MDLMLDIETLSQRHDAAVIAIGAVKFDPFSPPEKLDQRSFFFITIDMWEAQRLGRTDDATLQWWKEQDTSVQELMFSGMAKPIEAYRQFSHFATGTQAVWAKSPTFDCEIMRHLAYKLEVGWPWSFRQEFDVRTVLHLAQQERTGDAANIETGFPAHHPLGDALKQATQVQLAIDHLRQPTGWLSNLMRR